MGHCSTHICMLVLDNICMLQLQWISWQKSDCEGKSQCFKIHHKHAFHLQEVDLIYSHDNWRTDSDYSHSYMIYIYMLLPGFKFQLKMYPVVLWWIYKLYVFVSQTYVGIEAFITPWHCPFPLNVSHCMMHVKYCCSHFYQSSME